MYKIFRRLFKRGETPAPVVQLPALGEVRWSKDDEAWFGNYNGRVSSLAYKGLATPSEEVRAYARRILDDPSWLESSLAQAKMEALRGHPSFYASEIEALTLGAVHFYVHDRRGERILADLDGGKNYRAWR